MSLQIPAWEPDWDYTGRLGLVRVTANHLAGDSPWSCREQIARKARPAVKPVRPSRMRMAFPGHDTFPLGLARDALVSILSASAPPPDVETALSRAVAQRKSEVPDVSLDAAREAVLGYLAVLDELRADGQLPPDSVVRNTFFAVDEDDDGSATEWWAWGLLHVSRDSQLREFHLLRWREPGRPRSAASLAVVARVAADAVVAEDGERWPADRWMPAAAQPKPGSHVRVREIGVLDRRSELLLDDTVDAVRTMFAREVPQALAVLAGGAYSPGAHCATCSVRPECSGLARMPGVTGVIAHAPYTRRATPSDLVAHRTCSWRIHLQRELGLPAADQGSSASQLRGVAVHRWLEEAHGRAMACTAADLPDPADGIGPIAERLGWDIDQYRAARPYLSSHLDRCPVGTDDLAVLPEWPMAAWDTDADVVLSTRTDLVVDRGDSVIVRETKTVSPRHLPDRELDLLDYFPQAAVAVCMLADGFDPVRGRVLPPAEARPGRVQLELLTADDGNVVEFDPGDPDIVHSARIVVAELLDSFLTAEPRPEPGPACVWCPMATWCVERRVPEAPREVLDAALDASLSAPAGSVHPLDVVLYIEGHDTDDEIPF